MCPYLMHAKCVLLLGEIILSQDDKTGRSDHFNSFDCPKTMCYNLKEMEMGPFGARYNFETKPVQVLCSNGHTGIYYICVDTSCMIGIQSRLTKEEKICVEIRLFLQLFYKIDKLQIWKSYNGIVQSGMGRVQFVKWGRGSSVGKYGVEKKGKDE
ncbi:hypothetical protein POVCU2_0059350 [Plasmodium ovale curtisi]|uniref:Uncharacterized protein n=1 Tax=Plasmodium ovale curtisi TaxID=864141 RepID=A0A1A8WDE7_PLAOA|nr:hypothetical protein POVCU2_0059350 [Plasmodium ovale curtisi]SBS91909.1 hypothetical protein POVCU1_021400 [Plasmodium ovale curtisi]